MNFIDIGQLQYIIKTLFLSICIYITFLKISNISLVGISLKIKAFIFLLIVALFSCLLRNLTNSMSIVIVNLVILIGLTCSYINKINVGYSVLISVIATSFNYILYVIAIMFCYVINKIHLIENDNINLLLIVVIHIGLLYKLLKIKKLKHGISFFSNKSHDEYFDMIVLNISVILLFSLIILLIVNVNLTKSLFVDFIIFAVIMVVSIQKSIQLYYKKKLLIKELEETKSELDSKTKEIEKLEQENLNFSKKSHSLAHKQKALEFKLNELMLKAETAEELDVKDKLESISKELYLETATVELDKTGIEEVDTMLRCMQAECKKYKIDFDLQITGNIYYMTNNLVTKEELEILIADHIKDAIIAIDHSDNVNKSILVRLGEIDGSYGLYIYDSGIEFEKETLDNLGKKPCTTHKDEGGTGMGFMNTFETLRKHKASLIINEIGKPCKENYTKIIMIKFDGKNEFNVISYKNNVRLSMKKHDVNFSTKIQNYV